MGTDKQFTEEQVTEWISSAFQLNLPFNLRQHSRSEESLSLPRKGSQIAIQINFGYEAGRTVLFIINCTSLVATGSICDHGSSLGIANVSKCVRAVRHPHLRRQF